MGSKRESTEEKEGEGRGEGGELSGHALLHFFELQFSYSIWLQKNRTESIGSQKLFKNSNLGLLKNFQAAAAAAADRRYLIFMPGVVSVSLSLLTGLSLTRDREILA